MFLFKQFIFAYISTIGFSILFNMPKNAILKSGFNGALGWLIYQSFNINLSSSPIIAVFWSSISVSIIGEFFAMKYKKPATVFIIPGIVPLVPGAGMYYTMLAITERRFIDAANLGNETLFIAASISIGIIISSSISKIFRNRNKKTAK